MNTPIQTTPSIQEHTHDNMTGASLRKELVCSEIWGGNKAGRNAVSLPNLDGFIHASPCHQAYEGGDVYYLGACSGGLTGRLCLADVVGHGDDVAEVGQWFHQILRKRMNRINPAAIFNEVNRRVVEHGLGAMTTAICLSYDAIHSELHFASAGHPPPLLFSSTTSQWSTLDMKVKDFNVAKQHRHVNLPLGVARETHYTVSRRNLHPGDRLFIYSDGLIEAPNAQGELFGSKRLLDFLQENHNKSGDILISEVYDTVKDFAGVEQFKHDDITMMQFVTTTPLQGPRIYHFLKNNFNKYFNTPSSI